MDPKRAQNEYRFKIFSAEKSKVIHSKPPLVELGYSVSPNEILNLIRQHQPVTLEFLDGKDTCSTLEMGKFLGEGKTGTVFEIEDDNNKGLPVVIKEFQAKEAPEIKNNNGKIIYILSSSLNDVVMSSIFHSFYDGGNDFCITFPYFEGFFVCNGLGYSVIEKLDSTMSHYTGNAEFRADVFKSMVFQVLYGIKFLVNKQIMHNDMHAKNIMTRTTHGISYHGKKLDNIKYFGFRDGKSKYFHPNFGTIAKIMDFDFAAKYSNPSVVPQKVYNKKADDWNLQFRYSTSYDFMTFISYMVYYITIKSARNKKINKNELLEARKVVEGISDYVVSRTEAQVGHIPNLNHYQSESDYKITSRNSIAKVMDMVSIPPYRPYEKYCHLDLNGILDIPVFADYKIDNSSGVMTDSNTLFISSM